MILQQTMIKSCTSARNLIQNSLRCASSSGSDLSKLSKIVSSMKVFNQWNDLSKQSGINQYGNSETFNYATNPKFDKSQLQSKHLKLWSHVHHNKPMPMNGFEELIRLTEEGKLWHFPIDNEQGLDDEKQVPFEDHVFLDHKLEEFPNIKFIQNFMRHVISGLGRNPWMTVERKHQVIDFYKKYFEDKKQFYETNEEEENTSS